MKNSNTLNIIKSLEAEINARINDTRSNLLNDIKETINSVDSCLGIFVKAAVSKIEDLENNVRNDISKARVNLKKTSVVNKCKTNATKFSSCSMQSKPCIESIDNYALTANNVRKLIKINHSNVNISHAKPWHNHHCSRIHKTKKDMALSLNFYPIINAAQTEQPIADNINKISEHPSLVATSSLQCRMRCNHAAADENILKKHIEQVHEKTFACNNCKYTSGHNINLINHINAVHDKKHEF